MERKLADAEVSKEEKNDILKNLEKKETEYMRLQRHKMGVDDFDLLTIIGRGAFGEVSLRVFLITLLILLYLLIYPTCLVLASKTSLPNPSLSFRKGTNLPLIS